MLSLLIELIFLELNQLFFRTMHSKCSPRQNALPWGRGAASDHETSDVKTGDVEAGDRGTSESKILFFMGLDTVYLLKIEH